MAQHAAHRTVLGTAPIEGTTMSQTRELVDELLAAWNAHDLDRVMACYDAAYAGTDVGEAATHQGIIGVRKMTRRWFRAFPDLRVEPDAVIIQGDQVALGWLLHATHSGTFMRIPPTHRLITMRGVSIMTVVDGQITHGSRIWDMAAFLRSVGLLPDLRDSGEE
jgi:C-1 hydroxylase